MTFDIDSILRAVMERRALWDENTFPTILQSLASTDPELRVDWDWGAGEKWGSVMGPQAVVAIVHVKFPLAIVRSADRAVLTRELNPSVVVLEMTDWPDKAYSAQLETLEAFSKIRIGDKIDPAAFSAWDLWWISI